MIKQQLCGWVTDITAKGCGSQKDHISFSQVASGKTKQTTLVAGRLMMMKFISILLGGATSKHQLT